MTPEVLVERLRDRAATCPGFEDGVVFLEAADMIESLQAELLEEARLNGMGSEREAALIAKVEQMEREIKPWVGAAHTARTELITAKLKIEELEKTLLARDAELWLEKHRVHADDPRRTEPAQT